MGTFLMAKNKFKKKYQKKFKKTFNAWNTIFTPDQYLKLKAGLDTNLGRKINECIDQDFDNFSLDEQVQLNKELGEKFNA
jgi:predicted component of viral defense system (DUF524 family)